jgi:hypothetical protein
MSFINTYIFRMVLIRLRLFYEAVDRIRPILVNWERVHSYLAESRNEITSVTVLFNVQTRLLHKLVNVRTHRGLFI